MAGSITGYSFPSLRTVWKVFFSRLIRQVPYGFGQYAHLGMQAMLRDLTDSYAASIWLSFRECIPWLEHLTIKEAYLNTLPVHEPSPLPVLWSTKSLGPNWVANVASKS